MTDITNQILDRWFEGQSASRIRLDLDLSKEHVSRVVCKARRDGDPRAVIHVAADGRPVGRYRHRPPESMRI